MKDATGVIEGNGKATYQNIHEDKKVLMREGRNPSEDTVRYR